MNAQHVELWRRLEQFQIDSPEAALPFSARLARENNWSLAYTGRVMAEYKRFAFLAVAAGHPVSPSEDVDQAWHLHLTYSENYWKIFCPEILGRSFHHQPTKGGETEKHKFEDWYSRTLESYQQFFGAPPPPDIWPSPEARQKEKHDFIRIDRACNWFIPKPRLLKIVRADVRRLYFLCFKRLANPIRASERRFHLTSFSVTTLAVFALLLFCSGAMFANGANVFDWRGPDFLTFYIILFAATFGLALWLRRTLRRPVPSEPLSLPELDGYSTAFLNGGKLLTVNTAIANLVRQKAIRVERNCLISLVPEPAFSHELEKQVYAAAYGSDGSSISYVRSTVKEYVERIVQKLQSHGLVLSNSQARKAILLPLMLAVVAIAIGIIKIVIGVGRAKPVGFLVGLCFLSFILSLVALARPPRRTRLGDAVLKKLQERHIGSRRPGKTTATVSADDFVLFLGLFGMPALAGTELSDLRQSLQPAASSACGSSCGSSCGGGCGGGGCGGS